MTYHTISDAALICQALGRRDLVERIIRSYTARGIVPAYKTSMNTTAPYVIDVMALMLLPPVPRRGRPSKRR